MNKQNFSDRIILGIDPGTLITGYALIRVCDRDVEPIDFGCIKPPKKEQLSNRYHILYQSICHIIDVKKPTEMAIETPFIHKNPQSALKLGSAMCCALLAARKHMMPIFGYSPREVKQGISGLGGATKEDIAAILRATFHLQTCPIRADATDALSIAIHHSQQYPHTKRKEL